MSEKATLYLKEERGHFLGPVNIANVFGQKCNSVVPMDKQMARKANVCLRLHLGYF